MVGKKCESFRACGLLKEPDKKLVKWLHAQPEMTVRYGSGESSRYVYARFMGEDDRGLCHIDVATRDFFGEETPKTTHKIAELTAALSRLEGSTINVDIDGYFGLPRKSIRPSIFYSLPETKVGDVSIETVGVALAVRGAPIYSINWYLKGKEEVRVVLSARKEVVIGERYLEDCLELVENGFMTFVEGSQKNA
jgi:hypothetical protein